jgi:2-polyprenyl-6-hydroxyphenyl methylase/3-demethylubiquinone-9 3-methyltransferase
MSAGAAVLRGGWWDARGAFAGSLHGLNRIRLADLRARLGAPGLAADLGCGGGLISEWLARRGWGVVGIDLDGAGLAEARAHGAKVARLGYVRADALRAPLPSGRMDVVVAADVLEHVANWRALIAEAVRLARPGGLIYCNTINRTLRARLCAVWLAEGLGLVPWGTHQAARFIAPAELAQAAHGLGCEVVGASGARLRLGATVARWRLAFARAQAPSWGSYGLWLRRGP